MRQYNLNFNFKEFLDLENYIISDSNQLAYKTLIENPDNLKFIFLFGPKKSGKSHISHIWSKINSSKKIILKNIEIENIIKIRNNIFIDDVFNNLDEKKLFYLINHIQQINVKLLLTSNILHNKYQFFSKDLSSRIKSFHLTKINLPDDFLITNLLLKLFKDRQINIKNDDVINYICKRIERSFDNVFSFVDKLDKFSLSNKREIIVLSKFDISSEKIYEIQKEFNNITGKLPLIISSFTGEGLKELLQALIDNTNE